MAALRVADQRPASAGVITLLLAALLLAACATPPAEPPVRPDPERAEPPPPPEVRPGVTPEPEVVIDTISLEEALRLSSPQRERRLMDVADLALAAGDRDTAVAAIDLVHPLLIDHTGRARLGLLQGRLALLDRHAGRALTTIPQVTDGLPTALAAEIREARAEAFFMAGLIPQSVDERITLERLLPTQETIRSNRELIWETLMAAGAIELGGWIERAPSQIARGWLELARIVKLNATDPHALDLAVGRWRSAWPDHPADLSFIAGLRDEWRPMHVDTGRIAVLLPLSGRLAGAGRAITDGIVAAYLDAPPANRPVLRIHDVGEAPEMILDHYRTAVAEGASIIIGPLDKESVARLARAPDLPVPVLALNVADDVPPRPGLYQFGLNPEDETMWAAARALRDGLDRAVILSPRNEWGARLAGLFSASFRKYGGHILDSASFDPGAVDHSATITALLQIDHSRARHRRLQSVLSRQLHFTPRRRQDATAVIMVATPAQARLIRPQLRFHHAEDLPVFATSHIHSGIPNPQGDSDLDGVVYCDIPWLIDEINPRPVLRALTTNHLSAASRNQPRLVALGIDAYGVLPLLAAIDARKMRFDGTTGQLWTDDDGRVRRDLRCLQVRDGLPGLL